MKSLHANFGQNEKYLNPEENITEKQYFTEILDCISERMPRLEGGPIRILDLGCAAGDFLRCITRKMPETFSCCGVDVFPELLAEAARKVPGLETVVSSALELPDQLSGRFDVVVAAGLLTMFRVEQLPLFFRNIRKCLRNEGMAVLFSPFNKYGVDIHVDYRSRIPKGSFEWMTGYNCFSFATISEIVEPLFVKHEFIPFRLTVPIARSHNPLHSWTMKTEYDDRQHVIGLNLLLDRYYLILMA